MTTPTEDLTTQETRVRRAHLLVAVGVLVLCAVAYTVVALTLAGDLPDRVATHFGVDGTADDWMSRGTALWVGGLLSVGTQLVLLVAAVAGSWWRGAHARATTAFISALGAWLVSLMSFLYAAQRGLADSSGARLEGSVFLWATGIAVAVALAVLAVLPRPLPQPGPVAPEAVEVRPSEAVSWFGRARPGSVALWILLGTIALVALVALAVGDTWLWVVVLLTLGLVLGMLSFRVRIDSGGLAWRAALGWPRGRVPLQEVAGVGVREVRFGDFGGYGVRVAGGATGLITRSGPALEVRRQDGRRLVVTVDDAETAAGVLEGLRRRG